MDIDRRKNKNYYSYREFGHMMRNCRNRRMGMNRRIETKNNNNNLNRDRGLMGPN